MPTLIDCFGCPCLNSDHEDGYDCNLGCEVRAVYCGRENGWHVVSSDCRLIEIKTADKIIRTTIFELEIEGRVPRTWRAARL